MTTETKSASLARFHLGVAWAPLKFLQWSVDVPFVIYQGDLLRTPTAGISPTNATRIGRAPDFGDIGDVRVGVRLAWPIHQFKLGGQIIASVPTGDHEHLSGDQLPRADIVSLAEWGNHETSWVVAATALGVGLRERVALGDQQLGNTFNGGAAIGVHVCNPQKCPLWKRLELDLEGRFDGGIGNTHPAAFLLAAGGHVSFFNQFRFTALFTKGVGDAVGVPGWGTTIGLSYVPEIPRTTRDEESPQ